MDESDTVNLRLRIVRSQNKSQYDTYSYKNAPIFESVQELREFLMENYREELKPAVEANSFRLGYIVDKNRRLAISSNSNLDEVYSSEKLGWITLWAEADDSQQTKKGSKRNRSNCSLADSAGTEERNYKNSEPSDFDVRLKRLKEKHGEDLAEFKLRVWTKMLINGTHTSEDMPPKIPFFTGLRPGQKMRSKSAEEPQVHGETSHREGTAEIAQPERNTHIDQEKRIKLRSGIIQQLKDLKTLEESGILTKEQFEDQKKKLLNEMSNI